MSSIIKAIIIDDESPARELIRAYLKESSDVIIIDECVNGFEGAKAVNDKKPDLIFLDIQMPKVNGFEMLELLDHQPEIIFSTAFDQYALKAFEIHAADYLLKPYSEERFYEALATAKDRIQKSEKSLPLRRISESARPENSMQRIVVKNGNQIDVVSINDVEYFEAQDDYVMIYGSGKKMLKQQTMKFFEASLPSDKFVRIHRSFLINVQYLVKIEKYTKDTHLAFLESGAELSVSASGYTRLKEIMEF